MRTYEEAQEQRATFARRVMDTRAQEKPITCPLTRESCAGRSCACALRISVGWICGLTSRRTDARTRVVDVDADALLLCQNVNTAIEYVNRGAIYV